LSSYSEVLSSPSRFEAARREKGKEREEGLVFAERALYSILSAPIPSFSGSCLMWKGYEAAAARGMR
jgi:hypothetical protein